jgi:hypothetical protein
MRASISLRQSIDALDITDHIFRWQRSDLLVTLRQLGHQARSWAQAGSATTTLAGPLRICKWLSVVFCRLSTVDVVLVHSASAKVM